jgi:hypothetical protein
MTQHRYPAPKRKNKSVKILSKDEFLRKLRNTSAKEFFKKNPKFKTMFATQKFGYQSGLKGRP